MVDLMKLFRPRGDSENGSQRPTSQQATIALGGGGARGIAHLGVLESIATSTVQIERVVGVSIGSLVGALYCVEGDVHRAMAQVIRLLDSSDFQLGQRLMCGVAPAADSESAGGSFGWYTRLRSVLSAHRKLTRAVTSSSLISDAPLRDSIAQLIPDCDIAETAVPISIVAADLLTGQRIVLERGPLRLAIQASSAIPGIFPPVPWNGMLLCDIGVIETVPTLVAKTYNSDLTIAVDVGQSDTKVESCDTAMDVMMRMDDVGQRLMRRFYLNSADIVIRPDVGTRAWFDFTNPRRLIDAGRIATELSLNEFHRTSAA
ncbi:NTE family protein RssA [Rubripirellula reticaptiva]|uniref:NTE family protein RssA n=2 Tax=Rubripirellula reticaptiva TaxID=2528013 RepID=A0A5C6F234_9BACT|nr:NTE family protein RssA [Rubripirellula reticaptiva]